jgi:hypothetical protein
LQLEEERVFELEFAPGKTTVTDGFHREVVEVFHTFCGMARVSAHIRGGVVGGLHGHSRTGNPAATTSVAALTAASTPESNVTIATFVGNFGVSLRVAEDSRAYQRPFMSANQGTHPQSRCQEFLPRR